MDSRRQLRQQYKETPVPAGVYAIRNAVDGRLFIGASLNLPGALNRHRFELERGHHRNTALQDDWNRLGAQGFTFETVDRLKPRTDPEFDPQAELAQLLELWEDELLREGENSYPR